MFCIYIAVEHVQLIVHSDGISGRSNGGSGISRTKKGVHRHVGEPRWVRVIVCLDVFGCLTQVEQLLRGVCSA